MRRPSRIARRLCVVCAVVGIAIASDAALRAGDLQGDLRMIAPQLVPRSSGPGGVLADGATYWIVSSRRAPQQQREQGCGLDFFRRQTDGSLASGSAAALQSEMAPGVPVCIVIHGSFVTWDSQVEESQSTYRWLRQAAPQQPLQMIFYDWPSDGPYTHLLPVDIEVRGARAEFNGLHLAWLISLLPPDCPVCLIGHSHGARVALAALHLAAAGVVQDMRFLGDVGQRPIRAVVAAAAVDHDWLNPGNRYGRALCRGEVMNLRNRCDLALVFYPLARPLSRPALSSVGFTDGDRRRMGELGYRALEADVTGLVGRSHEWPNYENVPAIASAIAPFVYFTDGAFAQPAAAPQPTAFLPSTTGPFFPPPRP